MRVERQPDEEQKGKKEVETLAAYTYSNMSFQSPKWLHEKLLYSKFHVQPNFMLFVSSEDFTYRI